MAVQILNDMPDVAVHRGDSVLPLRDWNFAPATRTRRLGRPVFVAITLGLHVVAALAFLSMKYTTRPQDAPAPIVASIIDAPAQPEEAPPMAPPPMVEMTYTLPMLDLPTIETESITPPPVTNAISEPGSAVVPPMVESVQYVRQPAPVYPQESRRRRERGTVLLRVLVDPAGRPAQVQVERSSGFERLDLAAREAVERALFRPHEVNGVPQAAQVLIPIEFLRRAS
jgi:periplasmic protein TonB